MHKYMIILSYLLTHLQIQAQVEMVFEEKSQILAFSDSISMMQFLADSIQQLRDYGYLEAALDELTFNSGIYTAHLHKGLAYTVGNIIWPEKLENKIEVESRMVYTKQFREAIIGRVKYFYMENGYPFVTSDVEIVQILGSTLVVRVISEPGRRIDFGDIQDKNGQVHPATLKQAIDFKGIFKQSVIDDIPERMELLVGVVLAEPPKLRFEMGECHVDLDIKKLSSSSANALIGYSNASERGGIFGEAAIDLHHLFKRSEYIHFTFSRLQNATDRLQLAAQVPYLISSLGLAAEVESIRNDTIFTRNTWKTDIQSIAFKQVFRMGMAVQTVSNNDTEPGRSLMYRFSLRNGGSDIYMPEKFRLQYRVITGLGSLVIKQERRGRQQLEGFLEALSIPVTNKVKLDSKLSFGGIYGENLLEAEEWMLGTTEVLSTFPPGFLFTPNYFSFSVHPYVMLGKKSRWMLLLEQGFLENFTHFPYSLGTRLQFLQQNGRIDITFAANGSWGIQESQSPLMLNIQYVSTF